MFRWLTHRWLGVAGWVYLLGLILASTLYALLPLSSVVHMWKFNNGVLFQGFTTDHRRLVITELQESGPVLFHHLYVETGKYITFTAKDHPDDELDFQSILRQPEQLTKTSYYLGKEKGVAKLYRMDGSTLELSLRPGILPVRGGAFGGGKMTSGYNADDFALSNNDRWFITYDEDDEPWQPLLLWLKKHLSWDLTDTINGSRFLARIVNLDTLEDYLCDLQSPRRPTFQAHPEGQGFAAFDVRQNDLGTTTEINWHHLPPERGHHTFRQWTAILGVFLTPLLLSLCCSGIRRVRQKRTITMNHRLQTSM